MGARAIWQRMVWRSEIDTQGSDDRRADGQTDRRLAANQMKGWAEQKASYRFMGNQAVSHEALCKGHWEQTRAQVRQAEQTVLMVQDITELDYTAHERTQG
jgi:hypothetical protein